MAAVCPFVLVLELFPHTHLHPSPLLLQPHLPLPPPTSLPQDAVEIHDASSLHSVQLIRFASQIVGVCSTLSAVVAPSRPGPRWALGTEPGSSGSGGGAGVGGQLGSSQYALQRRGAGDGKMTEQVLFVCTAGADQLSVLKMVPLVRQVAELVEASGVSEGVPSSSSGSSSSGSGSSGVLSRCEEALNLCSLVADKRQLADINMAVVHEKVSQTINHSVSQNDRQA